MIVMSLSNFENFEKYLFDRKEGKANSPRFLRQWFLCPWFLRADFDSDDVPFSNYEVVRLSSLLFLNIQDVAHRYSEIQISHGLQFLIEGNYECVGHAYGDEAVDYNERCHAIRSMFNVFSTLFNKKSLSKEYDYLCFMWWEEFPYPSSPAKDIDYVVIETLGEILKLRSVNCVSSALNALFYCSYRYKTPVAEIIRRNMENIPAQLRSKALKLM